MATKVRNYQYKTSKNIKATCHPDRKHKAKGLCHQCYENSGHRENNKRKAMCHPEKPHAAHGLCKKCYLDKYLKKYTRPIDSVNRRREKSWEKHGFKITVQEYNNLLEKQKHVCAICFTNRGSKRLTVDHDHETGVIRGLLCDYCNRRLLIKRNTSDILRRAAEYIENFGFRD